VIFGRRHSSWIRSACIQGSDKLYVGGGTIGGPLVAVCIGLCIDTSILILNRRERPCISLLGVGRLGMHF
jgi:hypothetical protein